MPANAENTARIPTQARGRARFEAILAASEALLLERGLAGFSIPDLASRLNCTRTSIYHFFPTPNALLNELSKRYLERLENHSREVGLACEHLPWAEVLQEISSAIMRFHNAHPVGRMLILGAPASDESFRALELTISHLGRQIRRLMRSIDVELPREAPDAAALAVELGTACLRLSYHLHGEITTAYRDECASAMIRFLEPYAARAQLGLNPA